MSEFRAEGEFAEEVPRPGEDPAGTVPRPGAERRRDPPDLEVGAIEHSLMAAPVGEGERLISRSWDNVRISGRVEAPSVGVRHGFAEIKIGGTEFEADMEPADGGGFQVSAVVGGLKIPPGSHQVVAEITDEQGATGRATIGRLRAVDPSRSSSTSSGARSSTSSSGSLLSTTDENAIFGLSRAQAAVGTVGVGVAGAVLLSLL